MEYTIDFKAYNLGKKVNVTLYLNKELVVKAKKVGFNLSRLMENSLIKSLNSAEFPRGPTWNNNINQGYKKPQNGPIFSKSHNHKRISVADPQVFALNWVRVHIH